MFLVWLGVALLIAKVMALGPIASLSWMWVISPFILAWLWFEVIESALGLDKRKKQKEAENDAAKIERVRAAFAEPGKK